MTICYVRGCNKPNKCIARTPFGSYALCDEHLDRATALVDAAMKEFKGLQVRLVEQLRELDNA